MVIVVAKSKDLCYNLKEIYYVEKGFNALSDIATLDK
jgi:hypothetical protein